MILGLKEGLVECATVCVKSEVILTIMYAITVTKSAVVEFCRRESTGSRYLLRNEFDLTLIDFHKHCPKLLFFKKIQKDSDILSRI